MGRIKINWKKLIFIFNLIFLSANTWSANFSEIDFHKFVRKNSRVIFYFVSDGMPLSKDGLPLIQKVALKKNYKLQVLNDSVLPILAPNGQNLFPKIDKSNFYLNLGAYHHFPSTLVYINGKQCGALVPGYKDLQAFEDIVTNFENNCAQSNDSFSSNHVSETSILGNGSLVQETLLPRPIKYYYRPIDDEWVTYHDGRMTGLFSRITQQEIVFQGRFDSIPSPDAKYMTLPGPLRFFNMAEIFANPEEAPLQEPILTDNTMMDSYQSLGIVEPGHYRAITAWSRSVAFRDFFESTNHNGDPTLSPGEERRDICQQQNIATPIISKTGKYIGGFFHGDRGTNTTHVINIGSLGVDCGTVLNFGMRTSKVDFSYDDRYVTYMAYDNQSQNLGPFVQELSTGKIWRVTQLSLDDAFTFPSFLPNGNVIVLKVVFNRTTREKDYIIQEYHIDYENN